MLSRVRLGLAVKLAILILRESYYQMNRYQYERRIKKIGRWQLIFGVLMNSLIIDIIGLVITFFLITPPLILHIENYVTYEVDARIFSLQAIVFLPSFFTVFSNSWLIQLYGVVELLIKLPLSDDEINLSYALASCPSILWVIAAILISGINIYTNSSIISLTTAITILVSLFIGISIGYYLSALVGGRKYTGPSKRATFLQLTYLITYFLIFMFSYQVYVLVRTLENLTDVLTSVAHILPESLLLIYSFHTLMVMENLISALLIAVGWLLIGVYMYKRSFPRFLRAIVSPVYIKVGGLGDTRILPKFMFTGYKFALALKDIK